MCMSPENVNSDNSREAGGVGPGLRRHSSSKELLGLWFGANVLGFAIATPLSFLTTLSYQYFEALYIAGLIIGAVVGPLQAWVIQRQLPRLRLWQWTLANIVGSYIGSWVGLFAVGLLTFMAYSISNAVQPDGMVGVVLGISSYGLVIGMVLGVAQIFSLPSQAQNVRYWWTANAVGRSLGWLSAALLTWILSNAMDNFLDAHISWYILLGAVGGAVYAGMTVKALFNLNPNQLAP